MAAGILSESREAPHHAARPGARPGAWQVLERPRRDDALAVEGKDRSVVLIGAHRDQRGPEPFFGVRTSRKFWASLVGSAVLMLESGVRRWFPDYFRSLWRAARGKKTRNSSSSLLGFGDASLVPGGWTH